MAKRYFQKAKVSLTASILKDVFSKINSLTELYHPFSLSFQWGLWAKNTKALKQESIKKKKKPSTASKHYKRPLEALKLLSLAGGGSAVAAERISAPRSNC